MTSISAQNTFTAPVPVQPGDRIDVDISGTFTATVTLQRALQSDATPDWKDVETFTEPTQSVSEPAANAWFYRLGVKTGDYSDGTVVANLDSPRNLVRTDA